MPPESPKPKREHEAWVLDHGGCCDDHPSSIYAYCGDCGEPLGGWDWGSAREAVDKHRAEAGKIDDD